MELIYLSGKFINVDTIQQAQEITYTNGTTFLVKLTTGDTLHISKEEYKKLIDTFAAGMSPKKPQTAEERIRIREDKENRLIQRLTEDGRVIREENGNE